MVAILFEGKSDEEFFRSILSFYQLDISKILFYNFQGKDNILNIGHKKYDEIEIDISVGKIQKVLVVVDADNESDQNPNRGFVKSKEALKKLLSDLNFEVNIDFYIMCDEQKEGNLESFLLSVLEDTQRKCIDTFKECYQYELSDKWVYNSFYKQKKHPFDFSHSNFDKLKQKLQNLYKET